MQSAAKGDSRNGTVPVHVYGAEGLAAFLAHMLTTSDTYVIVPVLAFEFVPGPVDEEEMEPVCLNERANLYRVRLPPSNAPPPSIPSPPLTHTEFGCHAVTLVAPLLGLRAMDRSSDDNGDACDNVGDHGRVRGVGLRMGPTVWNPHSVVSDEHALTCEQLCFAACFGGCEPVRTIAPRMRPPSSGSCIGCQVRLCCRAARMRWGAVHALPPAILRCRQHCPRRHSRRLPQPQVARVSNGGGTRPSGPYLPQSPPARVPASDQGRCRVALNDTRGSAVACARRCACRRMCTTRMASRKSRWATRGGCPGRSGRATGDPGACARASTTRGNMFARRRCLSPATLRRHRSPCMSCAGRSCVTWSTRCAPTATSLPRGPRHRHSIMSSAAGIRGPGTVLPEGGAFMDVDTEFCTTF